MVLIQFYDNFNEDNFSFMLNFPLLLLESIVCADTCVKKYNTVVRYRRPFKITDDYISERRPYFFFLLPTFIFLSGKFIDLLCTNIKNLCSIDKKQ